MSIVRNNLMTKPGYTPYCGRMDCPCGMPRTRFDGQQFKCACGWRSAFPADFIAQYKAKWQTPGRPAIVPGPSDGPRIPPAAFA